MSKAIILSKALSNVSLDRVNLDKYDELAQRLTEDYKNNFVVEQWIELEEKIIKKVLRQLLHREPTIEDAKKCQRLSLFDDFDGYTLTYQGISLGRVQRDFDNCKISFTPIEDSQGKEIKT